MATPQRIFENGSFYHIYNRGNRKQQIFLRNRDYERFLEKVLEYKKKYPLTIVAYCLMPNHFHFLIQAQSNTTSRFFSDLCNSHSRYFNVKYDTVGSLYQGRFKAKKVEKDEYLIHLSRYIHLNPVEILSIVSRISIDKLLMYKWSSLPGYLNGSDDGIISPYIVFDYFSKKNATEEYKDFVASQISLKSDPIIDHLVFD